MLKGDAGKTRPTCRCRRRRKDFAFHLDLKPDFRAKTGAWPNHWRLSLKLRFRSFRSRLLFFFDCAPDPAAKRDLPPRPAGEPPHALAQIESSLRTGAHIFKKLIDQRNQQITSAAAILSRDHAVSGSFRRVGPGPCDYAVCVRKSPRPGQGRCGIHCLSRKPASFRHAPPATARVPVSIPETDREGGDEATDLRVCCARQRTLRRRRSTPLLAPDPIAWLCPVFRIDDQFAREIKVYTDLEITFFNGADMCLCTHSRCRTSAIR